MTLTTDDLRHALADAADAPYDAAGVARLRGVHARVRRDRQRRAAAACGVGVLAIVAVVAAGVLGGARAPSVTPAGPTPSWPARTPLIAPLPVLYRGQDVVAQLDGTDDLGSAKQVTVSGAVQVAVRCAAPAGQDLPAGLQVLVTTTLVGAVDPEGQVPAPCLADQEATTLQVLGERAASWPTALRLQAHFDRPVPDGTAFSVAVLTGENVIDLSRLRATPKGYDFVGSYALSEGWLYASGTATPRPSNGEQVVNGVQVALDPRRQVHLRVSCVGRQTLDVAVSNGQSTSVDCPAASRTTRTLDLRMPASGQPVLSLRVADADPGALVEVGISTR